MKRIHIVNPYASSSAMTRMSLPLALQLPALYAVSEGQAPDDSADLNFHLPYHTMVGYERTGESRHVVVYTHCNPQDVANLFDACERADAVVCMSFTGRGELVSYGVDPRKIHVIYSAADGFVFRRRNIGVVGFVQPNGRKREGLLLDLAWKYDLSAFHFVIVGMGWEPTVQALRATGASVQHIEALLDGGMVKFYQSIDALLVTGYVEGGPLPLLEAMSAGVPVISPPFGYAADLLKAEQMYETPEQLMDRLSDLAGERMTAHHLVRAWNWSDYAAEHALIFGRLLGESVDLYPERGMGRYAQLLDVIDECKPRYIVEIGTWKGNRAIQMIQQAAKYHPMSEILYQGFDLFEGQTGEQLRRELSKVGWPVEIVRRRIEATRANVELIAGDTAETLPDRLMTAEFYFIDGGHSEDTIRGDWMQVFSRKLDTSVIIFDDYYHKGKPEGVGCNAVIDELDRNYFEVTHLPVRTQTSDGREIGMVKVRLNNANLRVQVQAETHTGNLTWDDSFAPSNLSGVWRNHVESATDPACELGRAAPTP